MNIFDVVKNEIRTQRGCMGLELLRTTNKEETCVWTISFWESIDDLETYRASPLFQKTWAEIKPFFVAKAQAWTLESIEILT